MKKLRRVSRSTHIPRTKISVSGPQWKTVRNTTIFITSIIAYYAKDKVANDPNCGVFAVFDGHGGRQVADHCAERIGDEMRKEIVKTAGDLSNAIEQVFLRIDNELRLIDADNTGCTACVVIVR
jgi:serine/threonine protein phosphatase PrpC